ncbi:MAG: hypothetical protein ACKOU7_05160 [Ferruginibacter sp.]
MQNILTKKNIQADYLPELLLKQLRYETNTWKRLLDFLMDENIRFKNRLSEILEYRFNKDLLEEVERFQSRFIQQDEFISLLSNEIAETEKLLAGKISRNGLLIPEADKKLKRMRKNMMSAEKRFGRIKTMFNHFLAESIL